MSLPTVNSQEFLNAFQRGDYPAMVTIANQFAQSLAMDAAHDMVILTNIERNLLAQQQEEHERNDPNINYA